MIHQRMLDRSDHTSLGADTPLDIKLRLVKIFRHMHQDIGMARQVKGNVTLYM